MAVSECKIYTGRRGRELQGGRSEYSMVYQIKADVGDFQPAVLLGARNVGPDPLPRMNDEWTFGVTDLTAIVTSIDLEQDDEREHSGMWLATVNYGKGDSPKFEDENPLQRPGRWGASTVSELRPVDKDNGLEHGGNPRPLRNSAGEEFIDPIQIEEEFQVLTVKKNIGDLNQLIQWNIEYSQSVNSAVFRGGAIRTVRYLPIQIGDESFENNVTFWPCLFQFMFNAETWDEKIVDQGYEAYETANTPPAKRIMVDGDPTPTPKLLNSDGTHKTTGVGETKDFRVRPEKDFNVLMQEAGLQ